MSTIELIVRLIPLMILSALLKLVRRIGGV